LALSFAEESKRNKNIVNPYAFAITVASSAMFFRIMLEVAVLNNELLRVVAIPLGVMGILGLIGAAFLWVDHSNNKASRKVSHDAADIRSPFNIWPALKFALFFAVILFVSKFALTVMGNQGLYLTSLLSGFMDVDAITVSIANLSHGDLEIAVASIAIVIAAVTNTLAKGLFFLMFGNKQVAFRILAVFGFVLAGGIFSLLLI
jgi:uncharacterized membrane protein (DUF4010 family)